MSLDKLLLMSLRSPYLDNERMYPPLALLYLKSAVEKETDVEVDLIDDYDLTNPEMFKPYKWIGLSAMTPQRIEAMRVLNTVKIRHPDKKVIIGGPHALHYFNEIKDKKFDYIVTYDGQRDLVKILTGSTRRMNMHIMSKEEYASQPRPDRTSDKAKKFISNYNYDLQGRRASTMLTASGCTETCAFCEEAMTPVRRRKTNDLAKEMDDIISLGYSGVYIFDDLFALSMTKVKPIITELKKRDLIFRCNGQAKYFTQHGEDFAKLLSEYGCREIAFGHESGSQKILDNVGKRTTIEQNYQSIAYAKKHDMKVKSDILLGLPGENWETLKETENFIRNGGMDDFQCAIYYPYKGTVIRNTIDKNQDDYDLQFIKEGLGAYGQRGGKTECVVRTKALSSDTLMYFRNYLVDKYKPKSHKQHWNG